MVGKIIRNIVFAVCATVVLTGCEVKQNPVTWEDIASTIPSNPAYVVSVNAAFAADSALNDVWVKKDVLRLIEIGLALDSVRPDHFVVVALSNTTFVTWPLPNPRAIATKVEDWDEVSLNNTVDAHMLVKGQASLVLSSTQAWVVNNTAGADAVNNILSAAMNTKAVHTQPFAHCITATPAAVSAVVPYEGKYYAIDINHEPGLLRVDVDAYTKRNKRVDIIDGLGRLPIEFINQASEVSPFAAVEVERGTMPSLMKRVGTLLGKSKIKLGLNLLAPAFESAAGTVVARWSSQNLEIIIPFESKETCAEAGRLVGNLAKTAGIKLEVTTKADTLAIGHGIENELPKQDKDHKTPRLHSQTENPSAVAFARFDVEKKDPVELYFELAPTHARLQVDFKENAKNLAEAVELIKNIIFRVL